MFDPYTGVLEKWRTNMDFSEREDVKELAERIKLLIPGVQGLDGYMEQGALALAQASITSGLNPFLGEIWVLRQGRSGETCTGFSIKPGIKGARRAARKQAAEWGLIPPYYRPLFRTPSDFERQLMKAGQGAAAVACDLELLLPPDHPWYRDAAGERYTVTGLGMAGGGGSRMSPFQQARKRAEEDALKLAFDLPIYGESEDIPEAEPRDPAPAGTDPVTPVIESTQEGTQLAGEIGPMPSFDKCGPNFWNNLTRDLQQQGLIPNRAWLVNRFRRMGVVEVTEYNAQDLVTQALEAYGDPGTDETPENEAENGPETPRETVAAAGSQVDTATGEFVGPARPLSPSGVVALVQDKLEAARERYGTEEVQESQTRLYKATIGQLTRDPGEEADLLFYLLFSQKVDGLTRAELGAFFGWCLDPDPKDGTYTLNQWAVEEARGILNEKAEQKAQALAAQEHYAEKEAERVAHVDQVKADAETIPLPESMQDPAPQDGTVEDLEDPPTIQELEAAAEAIEEAHNLGADIDPDDLPFTDPPEEDETPEETEHDEQDD